MSSRLNAAADSDAIVITTGLPEDHRPVVVNQSKSNMFYKTKLCANFMAGRCNNGRNCSFAHGREDMRFPPPNWRQLVAQGGDHAHVSRTSGENKEQHKKMQPCKIFQSGKVCPYGEKCIFQHEYPRNMRVDDSGKMIRKSEPNEYMAGADKAMATAGARSEDAARDEDKYAKFNYWKTKTCTKYETTGRCPFGDTCHFAHGQAELQAPGGHNQTRFSSLQPPATSPVRAAPPPIDSSAAGGSRDADDSSSHGYRIGPRVNWIAREKGLHKISRVYGDWPDMPPPN
uniref:C3H1-type domain-containing protein n=1 Tax=Kalanchoe fedtschenkoi TaxID=63787 RepID=A0A7N0T8F5_KALFE